MLRSLVAGFAVGVAGQGAAPRTFGERAVERGIDDGSTVVLEGLVTTPEGAPAEGAVVTTSAGGRALVEPDGRYLVEARVPRDAESVHVTVVGRDGEDLVATATVPVSASAGWVPVGTLALARGGTCSPSWRPTFGGLPGTNGGVSAMTVHDDGGGPALYAGGSFSSAGSVAASRIARWDGARWEALGSGVSGGFVSALASYDDGGGPALYVGGFLTGAGAVTVSHVARWDGSGWGALGIGTNGWVRALAVFDDGRGPALYAGGEFTSAGGVAASRIARWDGTGWEALGSGVSGPVYALAVHDDGRGPALYAGGSFVTAGGITASNVGRWDGSSWEALGTGTNGWVLALAVHDDGSGPDLCAGGQFSTAGGLAASRVARWDGTTWAPFGSGLSGTVQALTVHDDGGGPALHAAGAVPGTVHQVARWNGSNWTTVGDELGSDASALAVYDDGGGPELFAGGGFSSGNFLYSGKHHVVRLDGPEWAVVGDGANDVVHALAVYDDGGGPALHVAGALTTAGGVEVSRVARWNGETWTALGSGTNGIVRSLAVHDDGGGPALYAGGSFSTAGGVAAIDLARWDGASWASLPGAPTGESADDLTVHDDGGGPELYATSYDFNGPDDPIAQIVRWDGAAWTTLVSGVSGYISALAGYDDGNGPALYAGGSFTSIGGVAASRIARWDGATWAALGSGTSASVHALTVFDDGRGPALYVGGLFSTAGGLTVNRVARWDGAGWEALGSGVGGAGAPIVNALVVHDDGSGPALCAGGSFTTAGGVAVNRIARWDGSSWSGLGSGMDAGSVLALGVFDDRGAPVLHAGGAFLRALDSGDGFVARWGCDPLPVLTCPSSIAVADRLADGPGEVVLFTVTAVDNDDPAPLVVCTPPSGSLFPPGTTVVTCTATDDLGNQSQCSFPVVVQPKVQPFGPPRSR